MTPWVLLLLTILCGYLTYDAFRWSGSVKGAPFSILESMWKSDLRHLSLSEQSQIRDRFSSFFASKVLVIFLFITMGMAVATVRAFLA